MRAALAAALPLALAACGSTAAPAGPVAASAAPTATARPTPAAIPTLDIFQLMGGAPATTVFALAGSRVRAVRLLDHFVKYEIAVAGGAQLLVSADGTRLVVADQPESGVRLRAFDMATGRELLSPGDDGIHAMLVAAPGRGALAEDGSGRILVLKSDGGSSWVDAYDGSSLRLVQRRYAEALPFAGEPAPCADRLLLAGPRIALVCLGRGTATVVTPGGGEATLARLAPGVIAGAAALYDGSIVAVTPAGEVYRWRPSAPEATVYGKAVGDGPVPRDGIAVTEDQVVVARGGGASSVQIVPGSGRASRPLPVPVAPSGGLLVASPYAYFTGGGALYHVDLNTGAVERMTGGFEDDAVPAALVAR